MSRSAGVSIENNFVKGVVTEFSGLNFPENACIDAINCVFSQNGEIQRRFGIDLEDSFTLNNIVISDIDEVTSYQWKNVAGIGDKSFQVVQAGSKIYFWNISGGSNISSNILPFTINLETLKVAGSPSTNSERCYFASGNGKLYVVHPYVDPFYVTYSTATNTVSTTKMNVEVRDFKILDTLTKVNENPTTLTAEHKYDLKNQGWTNTYIDEYYTRNGKYPSKAQLWWYYKTASDGRDFRSATRDRYPDVGSSLAPRGRYILNAFNQDRSSVSNISGLPSITSGYYRPSIVVFMNSRIFLSGITADTYNNTIYFSTIVRDTDLTDLRFHQRGDPTSETSYELLSNDGGTIVIPDAGSIKNMVQIKSALVVFCTNGVWTIQGSQGVGFSATDYSIEKLGDIPCLSASNFALVDGVPVWWNEDGIYTIDGDPLKGFNVVSISKPTIQSIYDTIPTACKASARAAFDRLTREVYWLYSVNEDKPTTYTHIMVIRVSTQAFYFYEISDGYPIRDILNISGFVSTDEPLEIIVTNGSSVILTNSDTVYVNGSVQGSLTSSIKFFCKVNSLQTCFAGLSDSTYVDWKSIDGIGINYNSSLVTGFRIRGDAQRKFNSPYIYIYSRQVPNSSLYVRPIWDWSNTPNSGRWGNAQQVYRANTQQDYVWSRKKLRGGGRALQLRYDSDENKPFHLIGWSSYETVNDRI